MGETRDELGSTRERLGRGLAWALLLLAGGYLLWSMRDAPWLRAWQSEANPLLFFAVIAVLPALGVPVTPLYILAGATFGARVGVAGTLVSLALNLILCHWIAKSALKPFLLRVLARFRKELPDLSARDPRASTRFILLVKFAPGLPSFAKNYLLGVSGVPFSRHFALSMLINGVYAVLFVVLGESLLEYDWRALLGPALLLALAGLGGWWFSRHRRTSLPPP